MQHGHVEQIGAPLDLYDRPNNLFVAGFIGSPAMNFIDATIHRANGTVSAVAKDGTHLPLPAIAGGREGQQVIYGVRPEHLELRTDGSGIPSEVVVVEPTGAEMLVVNHLAGNEVQAVFRERYQMQPGDRIALAPRVEHVHIFDKQSGARISE
jgi:multiple sugar transport system ATP-binding protein